MDLIGDIGATSSRLALLDDRGRLLSPEVFENASFTGLEGVIDVYLGHRRASDRPERAAFAIAAPILGDRVDMTNINWQFSQQALAARCGLRQLLVVNDFEALGWALPTLGPDHYRQIGGGSVASRAPSGVLGPGSGLGVASAVPNAEGWTAVAGEGGHVSLPALTAEETEVIRRIREDVGHCSAERVLSGPGLVRLYMTLADIAGRASAQLKAADVTALAHQGEPLANSTLAMFFDFLGTVASNLALTIGARGGIYIAGGIVPRMVDRFAASGFRERFVAKGRYRGYLEAVPTFVITDEFPAMRGLRYLLGYR